MKPKQALDELEPLTKDKNAVTTKRFRKCYQVISGHIKMLEKDNRKLRNQNKNYRRRLRDRYE